MKTLRVTLEVEVTELSAEDRIESADGAEMNAEDLPGLEDTDAADLADALFERDMESAASELLAGSDIYVGLRDATVISAEWAEPKSDNADG